MNNKLIIQLITTAFKTGKQPALRWLKVWFNKRLTFYKHMTKRAAKA
jgi:hypothetical protein